MKNTDSAHTPRRAATPGAVRSQRREPPATLANSRYVARSMGSTFKAFTVPTILAPLLPPFLQPLRLVVCGAIYADQQQQPADMRFRPPLSRNRECVALLLGLSPFVPAFALQTYLTETWCADPHSLGGRMAAGSAQAWAGLCDWLPQEVGRVAARYPINFVLARCMAQLAAALVGGALSGAYYRLRDARLVAQPLPAPPPRLHERLRARPEAYVTGALPFCVPALLDSRLGRMMLQAPRMPRATPGIVITSSLVGAAMTTSMINRGKQQ